ncbi:PREDICTED: UHRF1-binding protein 1-like, partial [Rhagoletis zephyria]|uniref:UHRF1-binding protein 1-like n=1 Tax=Rhagoletis zephyria TaxID=28612 RepID=UPI0008118327
MASLLKNQILKHLSKFTKNLSPEKLQMSTMRGSFEVNNIELNEQVLMELLELPVWLSLTKAHCNYASVKINWIKIKTIPIYIVLDEVTIEAETCEDFRESSTTTTTLLTCREAGSYGFINKVIDGITLSINSVNVQFRSAIFSASFELTRITIESRSCLWKAVDDLSKTRIRDPARGQVLVFKHIEWQTLRFVAKSETKQS